MSVPHALLAVTGVLALTSSLIVYRRTHALVFEMRALSAIAASVACLLAFALAALTLDAPTHDWGAARFAQSVALMRGYDLYYPETSGPLLSSIYGPVSVLLYLPAAAIDDISRSMYAASLLKFASLFLPLLIFFVRACPGRRGFALVFGVLTAGAMLSDVSMFQILGALHVDAPAVGLGLLSCACLLGPRPRPGAGQLALAASCAVLAAWTKQVDATIVVGQFLWLWLAHGRAVAGRYFLWCALSGAAITLSIGLVFGFQTTLFNVLSVPGAHAFYPFRPILKEAMRMSAPYLLVVGWAVLRRPGRARMPLAETWGLPFLAALALFPTSFLGRAKVGGYLNSWHSHFFLIVAAGLALCLIVTSLNATKRDRLITIALVLLPLPFAPIQRSLHSFDRQAEPNRLERALAFCRAHPGQAFFPWNPLVTLHSDGRLYHFEWALRDRAIAGYAPSDEHFRSHLPERLTWVVYPADKFEHESPLGRELIERLPEFSRRIDVPELPGYAVFVRENEPQH